MIKKFLKQVFSTENKLKIEKFFVEQLWQILIVFAFIFMCSWLFDKYIEAVLFCISHLVIRAIFEKQYHCGTTVLCLVLTMTIVFFGLMYTFPVELSLLSAVPMCWFISWVGYMAQDRIDFKSLIKNLEEQLDVALNKIEQLCDIDIYKMTEDELRQFGASKGLSETQIDVLTMRVIEHLKISEICKYKHYGRTTIKYHISEIKKKLGLERV